MSFWTQILRFWLRSAHDNQLQKIYVGILLNQKFPNSFLKTGKFKIPFSICESLTVIASVTVTGAFSNATTSTATGLD